MNRIILNLVLFSFIFGSLTAKNEDRLNNQNGLITAILESRGRVFSLSWGPGVATTWSFAPRSRIRDAREIIEFRRNAVLQRQSREVVQDRNDRDVELQGIEEE